MNEQDRDREWLGELTSLDLTDLSFGTFDLSRGSTNEWWESVKEIPMDSRFFGISTDEIEAELKRRKEAEKEKPEPINGIFPKGMQDLCEDYVNEVWSKGYEYGADFKHYIFENAVESVFGKDIFEKLNKRNNDITNDR